MTNLQHLSCVKTRSSDDPLTAHKRPIRQIATVPFQYRLGRPGWRTELVSLFPYPRGNSVDWGVHADNLERQDSLNGDAEITATHGDLANPTSRRNSEAELLPRPIRTALQWL